MLAKKTQRGAKNKQVLKQHGIIHMKSEQNILMGYIHVEIQCVETSSMAVNVEKSPIAVNQDTVVPIRSIVVESETKPPQETLHTRTITETSDSCNAGVVDNRLCGPFVINHFIG